MASISKRSKSGQRPPKTLAQFNAMPKRSQVVWDKMGSVVTRVRKGDSLRAASANLGIDPRTVVRLAGSALRKNPSGRYVAKPSDNLLRIFGVPIEGGRIEVGLRGSRASTAFSKQQTTQRDYLSTGDNAKLRKLWRKKILDAEGNQVPFLTDLDELERQGDLGVLSFESIYARRG